MSEKSTYLSVLEDSCPDVAKRYVENIAAVGVDPFAIKEESVSYNPNDFPPVSSIDLISYLVLSTSFYMKEQMKAYKSLDEYKFFKSGFVNRCGVMNLQNLSIIVGTYDKDHDGFLRVGEVMDLVEGREYENDIPQHAVEKIHAMSDKNKDDKIDFQEFVEMINNPDLKYVFGHYVNRYIHMVVPRTVSPSITVPDGIYEEQYSCYPPAVGMIIISLIEIIFFCVDEAMDKDPMRVASGPVASVFVYDPCRREEAWRYITYMFVHIGVFHLIVNLAVQIMLGVPLEMVHKWWRVLLVYFAGVLAGSLGTSIADPSVKLAGASGGVYSLITAHIASIIMNWKEMSFPLVQLLIFVVITGSDVGTSIYNRYVLDMREHIGYVAHFAGAVAGLLVGFNVLRNLVKTRTERVIWWASIVIYVTLMGFAIIWNAAYRSYYPKCTI